MQINHRLVMMLIAIFTLIASWVVPEMIANRAANNATIVVSGDDAASENLQSAPPQPEEPVFAADIPFVSFQESVSSPFDNENQTLSITETKLPDNLSALYRVSNEADANDLRADQSGQSRTPNLTFSDVLEEDDTDTDQTDTNRRANTTAYQDDQYLYEGDVIVADIVDTPNKRQAPRLNNWYINASVFNDKSRALRMQDRLEEIGYLPKINELVRSSSNTIFFQVQIGPYLTEAQARAESQKLRDKTGFLGSIVKR